VAEIGERPEAVPSIRDFGRTLTDLTVEFELTDSGTRVVTTVDDLHDEVGTKRLLAGRTGELDNLGKVVGGGVDLPPKVCDTSPVLS
jgi:hypothetical protein